MTRQKGAVKEGTVVKIKNTRVLLMR